ncbi:unnamed protein product [Cylicocyclus nassatus]|uniref:glutathione transferase n=1 Tax=Cylicocyclus nassatus TaxID=53992 RepID=A0AA36HAZ0_CYLNA|nr:unnamed protein product [Cylicocyclus nassatus]
MDEDLPSMIQYKLIYFDGRGTAEIARQLFVVAAQPYEDERINKADWQKLKPEMPFEQLPVLEVSGQQLAQSYAICRYLARQFGYAGKTPFEEAVVDSIADQMKDYMVEIKPFLKVVWGFEEGDLEALKKDVFLPARGKLFLFISKFLKGNPSGFLVGDSLTWADLYLAEHVAVFGEQFPEMLEGYPEIKAHSERIHSHPLLKNWIETRPKTKF